MGLPSVDDVNEQRVARFKAAVRGALETEELGLYREVAQACQDETGAEMVDIAAALARLLRGGDDLFLSERAESFNAPESRPRPTRQETDRPGRREQSRDDSDKATYRIEVGRVHGVKPGNIVGAIANEGGLDSAAIGRVVIRDQFSLVDLPRSLDAKVLGHLGSVRVAGQALKIREDGGPGGPTAKGNPKQRSGFKPPRQGERRGPNAGKPAAGKSRSGPAPAPRKDREQPVRERPTVSRAQRKAGHGTRRSFKK
jgi:ATP-dependent RNA helicase DeaD